MNEDVYNCEGYGCDHRDCRWRGRKDGTCDIKRMVGTIYMPKESDSPGWNIIEDCIYYKKIEEKL